MLCGEFSVGTDAPRSCAAHIHCMETNREQTNREHGHVSGFRRVARLTLVLAVSICVFQTLMAQPVAAARFSPGQVVVVANAGASGVNVRYGSGLRYAVQRLLPNGSRVSIKSGPRWADGFEWWDTTGFGNSGWVIGSALQPVPQGHPAAPPTVPFARPSNPANPVATPVPGTGLAKPTLALLPKPDVRLLSATYSSLTITAADILEVSVLVRNDGGVPAPTAGWMPGTTHHLFDVAPGAPRGTWRLTFECGGLSAPYGHALRYGLGAPLGVGEVRRVTMRFVASYPTPAYKSCAVGLVEEQVAWRADRFAPAFFWFGGGSAGDPVQEFFEANRVANGMLFAATGFQVEDREFWQRNPTLAVGLAASNVFPIGKLLSAGLRLVLRDSRELLVDAGGHVVASRGVTGARAIVGETNALAVASRFERFRPLADFGVHNVNANGPDQLGHAAGRFTVLEAKAYCCARFTLSDLGDQLTTTWMRANTSYAKGAAGEFSRSISNGTVYRILVVTRRDGVSHGIADEVLTRADVAYEVSENGTVLHRYVP